MEMGTGKTLTTIAVAGRLWLKHKADRMLIVAPLSILGVWQEEFQKFAAFCCQRDAFGGPDEQLQADFFLKVLDGIR